MVAGGAGGGGFEVMVDVGREREGVCDVDGFKSNDMWKCSEKVVCGVWTVERSLCWELGAKTVSVFRSRHRCVYLFSVDLQEVRRYPEVSTMNVRSKFVLW